MMAANKIRLLLAVGLTGALSGCARFTSRLAVAEIRKIREEPAAAEPTVQVMFAAEPAVRKEAGVHRIAFAVSAPTDVEVAILDDQGKTIRHLAAGRLGPDAPEPFVRNRLQQELVWDGKDDAGQPMLAGNGSLKSGTGPPPSFSVRVRIGSSPRQEKILGWDGNTFGRAISGLTVGPGGEVFVLISHTYRGRSEVRALDKEGRYLRTILPYAADTPPERSRSLGTLTVDGQLQPVVQHYQSHNFAPFTSGMRRQSMAFSPAGHVIMVSPTGSVFDNGGPRHLLALHPEGGAPDPMPFVGPMIRRAIGRRHSSGSGWEICFDHVVTSPDGRWIYLTLSDASSFHTVFRLDARPWLYPKKSDSWLARYTDNGMEEGFLGVVNRPGSDEKLLNDPQGLAVDAQGRIYVCDRGNDRVAIHSPEGWRLAEFAVPSPQQIGVHRKTGDIYVLSRERGSTRERRDFSEDMDSPGYYAWLDRERKRKERGGPPLPTRLIKFSAYGEEPVREVAAVEAPLDLIALDPETLPAQVWASTTRRRGGLTRSEPLYFPEGPTRGELLRVTDLDGQLEIGKPVSNEKGLRYPWFIAADPDRNRVLIREDNPHPPWPSQFRARGAYKLIQSLDLDTGELSPFINAAEVQVGPDGTVFAIGTSRPLFMAGSAVVRFDPDGQPSPWPGGTNHVLRTGRFGILGNSRVGSRGYTIAPNGDLYLLRSSKYGPERGVAARVDVYGPDGSLKREALIDGMGAGDCGIAVDAAGNMYVGANLKPADRPYPSDFMGQIPERMWTCWGGGRPRLPEPWRFATANYYLFAYGAAVKFGPEGGAFYGRVSPRFYRPGADDAPFVSVTNAPPSATRYRSGSLAAEVAVEGAQWLFHGMGPTPDLDISFGDGDCICTTSRLAADPFGRVFVPDVFRSCVWMLDTAGNRIARIGRYGNADDRDGLFFAWPAHLDAAADRLYVSDSVNRRVTVVGFDWSAEKSVPLP